MFLPDERVHAILDATYGGGPTLWCGLSTTVPELVDGVYVNITEPASYDRVEVPPGDWPTAAERAVQVEVQFPDPVDDLGVIVAWFLATASTAGTVTDAGVPEEPMNLPAGASDVVVTCRIESPADLTTI